MGSLDHPAAVTGNEGPLSDPSFFFCRRWRTDLDDVDGLDYEIPATPAQEEIVRFESGQWCQMNVFLPSSPKPTTEKINTAWRVLSALHPCLRTVLYTMPENGKLFHRVLRGISNVQHGGDAEMNLSKEVEEGLDDQVAFLTLRSKNGLGLTAKLNIRRALVDSTSLGALNFDFALIYRGILFREPTPMRAYINHIQTSQKIDNAKDFWGTAFVGASAAHAAPQARKVQWLGDQKHSSVAMYLEQSALPLLSTLESEHMYSRKRFFEALWALVLHHHVGTQEVVFATAERDCSFGGYESCVGCLDQVYPVRIEINDDKPFAELVGSLDGFHNKASPHGHLGYHSIEKLAGLSSVESLFQYSDAIGIPSLAGTTTDFPMMMFVNDCKELSFTLFHNHEIEAANAEMLLQHFANAVQDGLGKILLPGSSIDSIDLSSKKERESILLGARASNTAQPSNIPALFEAQVQSHPSAPAIQFEKDKPLTFDELNRLANSLARTLRFSKLTFVPLCMDRSVELIACLLAVLKSGAAYVILDPDGASQRNRLIVEECEAEVVLVNRKHATNFKQPCIIEDVMETIRMQGSCLDSNLEVDIRPDDPSYVIYTSGSTGTPKGVVLTHGAATSGISCFSLNGMQRWLLFYNPIFSAAQRTMIATLVKGGCLLLVSKAMLSTSLGEAVELMNADALGITPSALSLLSPSQVPTLKQITLVGEQVPPGLLETWCGHVSVRNTYGLSECTQLNFGRPLTTGTNPRVVGRPSDTTSAFVLKSDSTILAPLGTVGELCLAGPQLGRGYLKKAEQTAKVFIDNPFGVGRLYRTGDTARQHSDGTIEIVGRLDFQVKINGQRIEPKEVDEALIKHSAVQACATVAATMGERKVLVASVVPNVGQKWRDLVNELRHHVEKLLPSYMMPSFWMPLEGLPTNANGKLDVLAIRSQAEYLGPSGLLRLCQDADAEESAFTNETELTLRNVWAKVLQIGTKSIHHEDTFVALGGSSLQAITAVTELRKIGIAVELAILVGANDLDTVSKSCNSVETIGNEDPEPFAMIPESSARQIIEKQAGVVDAYPVTPLQEGLLAASLGGNDAYLYQRVWDVTDVDLAKLRNAMQTVFNISDILRTAFTPHEKSYMQIVKNNLALPWIDSSADLTEYKKSDKEVGIGIGEPLFRVALLQRKYLVVTMHHSLFDFWSHRFLYQDVASIYYGVTPIERPPFKRFVKNMLDTNFKQQEEFWKDYLLDANPTIMNNAPRDNSVSIERHLPVKFRERSSALGITAGSVVYAAWAIVLSRHVGSPDVSFATTLSGREMPVSGIDRLDGPTLTSVPQRVTVDNNRTILDLTKSVNTTLFQVMKHSQCGMRKALSFSKAPANFLDTLVNVLVKNEDDELSAKIFKRFGSKPVWQSEYTTLEVEELQTEVVLRISSSMESRRSEFILDSVALTIEAILEGSDRKVGSLNILGPKERAFLAEMHRTEDIIPTLLHEPFESYAKTFPERLAIDWDSSRNVTYKELNDQADLVASYLCHHGIGRGDIVPLLLDKSVDTIIAILGTMKAGAAYVPLSPENPVDRNVFIINDVGGRMIISQSDLQDFSQHHSVPMVSITEIMGSTDTALRPVVNQSVDDLAYVIYTSGSTGKPKGVKVPHRSSSIAIASMLRAGERMLHNRGRVTSLWRTLQFANYVFDASVEDIFNTLSSGGTLCMASHDTLMSDLSGAINRMQVKQAILTPTVAKLIDPRDVPTLEILILGGEPLTADLVEKWAPHHKLLNVYGPTETSMVVTAKEVHIDDNSHNIGKPFTTVSAYILDKSGSDLVPYGATGELCISGPQLSLGYVNNEQATNASFVPCRPLGIDRMYRTGDLARWYPGGDIECLGRKDNQVKIHGHRIELGEVEQAIDRTGIAHDCAVILTETNKKLQLTAFAVFNPTAIAEIEAPHTHDDEVANLRDGLSSLAPYMIPKVVLPVGKLPELVSGKVDRKLLKKWAEEMSAADLNQYSIDSTGKREIVPVVTEEEAVMEKIWAEILCIDQQTIGALANFFSLGGDSVSAINIVSLCRAAGYSLAVSHILKFPVLRELTMKLKKAQKSAGSADRQEFATPNRICEQIQKFGLSMTDDIDFTYPVPPGQAEFLNQAQRSEKFWVLMTVRPLAETDDIKTWIATVIALTRANDILRTFWVRSDGDCGWVGVVLKEPYVDISFYDCKDQGQRSEIIESVWNRRFVFGKPWIRYAVLNHWGGKREILIMMDHAVYDGTLLRIFDAQFSAIQKGAPLPAHEEFRDFARHIWSMDKTDSLKYWTELMADKTFAYPNADNPKVTALIVKPMDINLDEIATRCSVTPSIVFQTAFQLWLARASMQRDVSFDYLLSGRNIDLPNPQLINGNLANILPVRSRIGSGENLAGYMQATQDIFWEVTENGNVGLDAIYGAANVSRSQHGNRILFLFQPFEPTTGPAPEEMQWVVMKLSEVRMYQPYALVVEISKTLSGYKLKIMYDEVTYTKADAQKIGAEHVEIVEKMRGVDPEVSLEEFL